MDVRRPYPDGRLSPRAALAATAACLSLAACATSGPDSRLSASAGPRADYKVGKPYQVRGVWYTPAEQPGYDEVGIGSWYGDQFHNRHTADGEAFDMDIPSAAHKTLPLPCLVEVTNLDNNRKAVLRVNDRGPFVDGRIIDLSRAAAEQLGYRAQGVARVRVRYVGPAPFLPGDGRLEAVSTRPEPPRPPLVQATTPDQTQIGAFASRANAERALARASASTPGRIVETDRSGQTLYRVVVDLR